MILAIKQNNFIFMMKGVGEGVVQRLAYWLAEIQEGEEVLEGVEGPPCEVHQDE